MQIRTINTKIGFIKKGCTYLTVLLCLGGVTYGGIWLMQPDRFPITNVKIIGEHQRLSHQALETVISEKLTGGFFGVEVNVIRNALEAMPWVRHAYVRRVWPSQLVIQIEEAVPFARWNDEGIITVEGELIHPPSETVPNDLPRLEGPPGRHRWVWEQYRTMSEILAHSRCSVARLMLAKRGSWKMLLDNHILVVLGKSEINTRLERFVDAYQRLLATNRDKIAYVDLRYTSGLAVGWRRNEG